MIHKQKKKHVYAKCISKARERHRENRRERLVHTQRMTEKERDSRMERQRKEKGEKWERHGKGDT
jgi:hypothetical protein